MKKLRTKGFKHINYTQWGVVTCYSNNTQTFTCTGTDSCTYILVMYFFIRANYTRRVFRHPQVTNFIMNK